MAHPNFNIEEPKVENLYQNLMFNCNGFVHRVAAGGLVAGLEHSVALTKDGGVFSWGSSKCVDYDTNEVLVLYCAGVASWVTETQARRLCQGR